MTYGICLLSVVSCRKEASNTSELVTQLLFGETYEIAEESEEWFKIIITFDNYVCWLNKKQHNPLSESAFEKIQKHARVLLAEKSGGSTRQSVATQHGGNIDAFTPSLAVVPCGAVDLADGEPVEENCLVDGGIERDRDDVVFHDRISVKDEGRGRHGHRVG